MVIYCVRHGQSVYNAEGRVQGHSDVPLSEFGLRQGLAVAAALAQQPIQLVLSSPLRRALQTAEPLAERLNVELKTDRRLMEIHAGIFQDRRRDDLEREFPGEYSRWRTGDPDYVIPGGESRQQVVQRGLAAFGDLCRESYQQVAVVTHGAILISTIKALVGLPAAEPPHSLENASISRLEWKDGRMHLLELNEIAHLTQVGVSGSGDL